MTVTEATKLLLIPIFPVQALIAWWLHRNDTSKWTYDAGRKYWLKDVGSKIMLRKTQPFAAYSAMEKIKFFLLAGAVAIGSSVLLSLTVWKNMKWLAWIVSNLAVGFWVSWKVNDEREKV